MTAKTISVVVSVYNEEDVILLFCDELFRVLSLQKEPPITFEVIFVNDGSTDRSQLLLDEIVSSTSFARVIHFSRNFGHEAAMLAGIEHATGDAVICMDSDLQHPPSCIPQMVAQYIQGHEIITMIRDQRADGGILKKISSSLFYWTINVLTKSSFEPMASDFFLISTRVARIITSEYKEKTRFLRGIIQSVGFQKTALPYRAPKRKAGKSKYSIFRLFFLSLSAIATFSHVPLRLGIALGLLFGGFSLLVSIYSLFMKIMGQPFSGYTTIVVLLSSSFAMLFIVMGIIGEYIGYIFTEVKNRPGYIIDRVTRQENSTDD